MGHPYRPSRTQLKSQHLTATTSLSPESGTPPYDQALTTRRYCVLGLWVSYAAGLASLGAGVAILATTHDNSLSNSGPGGAKVVTVSASYLVGELIPLVFNVFVTACTESIGYIHAVSLRWALYYESRLTFNSNLRLFTSAKSCPANSRPANAAAAICLIISYTAASQTLQMNGADLIINGMALLLLGLGLLGLSGIATACLRIGRHSILSWSPNPLNTALACAHNQLLHRRPGRGLLSVHDLSLPAQPTRPRVSQRPMKAAHLHIRRIILFQYVITALSVALAATITAIVAKLNRWELWTFFQDSNSGTKVTMVWAAAEPAQLQLLAGFVLAAILQAFFVLALHCAELLVNVWRDESAWRAAHAFRYARQGNGGAIRAHPGTGKGAMLNGSALGAAARSGPWLVLLVLKPVSGWLFTAQGARLELAAVVLSFNPIPLLVLAGLAVGLLAFEEALVNWRRRGPQPATLGHLQTLVDLVDDWDSGEGGKLWWGTKRFDADGVGVTGSSGRRESIAAIDMTAIYH